MPTPTPPVPSIFISYRRNDSGGHAGRLFDRLRHWFDNKALFYDQRSIDIGADFPADIADAVDRAVVMLVVIGPDWLDEIKRRLTQPDIDFVRREIALALARGNAMTIIPVLVGGAETFESAKLDQPLREEIAALADLSAHVFQGNDADYDNQFVRLRARLAGLPGVPAPRFRLPDGVEQPRRLIDHQISPHFQDPNGLLPHLHAQLQPQGSTALVARAALYGMGGIGKTQLARKYSLDYPDNYAGIWTPG